MFEQMKFFRDASIDRGHFNTALFQMVNISLDCGDQRLDSELLDSADSAMIKFFSNLVFN